MSSSSGRYPMHLSEALAKGPLGLSRIPGSVLGPYVIEAELGRGGMGAVLRARHGPTGRSVALKVLLAGAEADDRERRRFEREGRLGAELGEGVVPVLEVGEEAGLSFIAFELVEGGTLAEAWEGASPVEVVTLLLPVVETLGRAHARGVVHRDLKPANVLVRASDRRPMLADLGLGRDMNLSSSLTRTGAALGTPAYMAPEQVKGKTASPASDVFSLGVMLYEGLTGDDPFEAGNIAQRYAAMLSQRVEPPSQRNPAVPRELDAVVLRCLQSKPERRYPDASALAVDLTSFLRGALPAPPGKGRALALAALALLAPLLGALAWVATRGDGGPQPAPTATSEPSPVAASPAPSPIDDAAARERRFRAALARARAPRDPDALRAAAEALAAAYPERPEPRALRARFAPWRQLEPPGGATLDLRFSARRATFATPEGPMLLAPPVMKDAGEGLWRLGPPPAGQPAVWTTLDGHGSKSALAATWDAARARVIAFGGSPPNTDAWSQEGGWTRFKPERTPQARSKHALVYDARRDVVVLFGGRGAGRGRGEYLDDLWEFDGVRWAQRTFPAGPGPRAGHALIYEPARQRVLLYGGHFWGKTLGDLWSWDGEGWTRLDGPGPRPVARQGAAVAAVGDGRVVLFSGGPTEERGAEADTWVLDREGRWERRYPAVAPTPRRNAGAVWDATRGAFLLIGGEVWTGRRFEATSELWEYRLDDPPEARSQDPAPAPAEGEVAALVALAALQERADGEAKLAAADELARRHPTCVEVQAERDALRPWRRALEASTPGPGARAAPAPALVWHPTLRGLLLFGGNSTDGLRADLWLWKDGRWLSLDVAGQEGPAPRKDAAACWDARDGQLLVWGGRGAEGDLADLWAWSGAGWRRPDERDPRPSARGGHGLVWDEARGALFLCCGTHETKVPDKPRSTNVKPLGDAWVREGGVWRPGPRGPDPLREKQGTVYDVAGRRTLVFGGEQFGPRLDDLWAYEGERWRELPRSEPWPTRRAAMGIVATDDGRLVVFGGRDPTGEPGDDLWVFDGARWEPRWPLAAPPGRYLMAMGWDPERRVVVLYGGLAGRERFGDVWEYELGPRRP